MGSGIKVGELYGTLRLDKGSFDRDLDKSGIGFKNLAKIAVVSGALIATALVAIGGAALGMAIDFEKGMANVQTLIGSGSAADARIGEFKQEVKDLSISTGTDLANMTDGLYQVISAWGDTADTTAILEISAKSAKAGLATTTDAVNLLSTVTKGYGDTSQAAVQKAADLAFQTANLGQTTFPELAASMGKVIPLAATLKVSQEELFGAMATLTGVTGNTAEVSTQLKAVMTALVNGNPVMIKALKAQGFASGDVAVKTLGLSGTLDMLMKASGGSNQKLAQMLGSSEALTAVLALTGNQAEDFKNKTDAMSEAGGKNVGVFAELRKGIAETTDRIRSGKAAPAEYADVINEFKNNLGLTDEQIAVFLTDLEKVGETKALDNLAEKVQGLTGATETAFQIQQKTVSASMDKISASVGVLMVSLGEKLLPVVAQVLDWVLANGPKFFETLGGAFDGIGGSVSALGQVFTWINENIMPSVMVVFNTLGNVVLPALREAFAGVLAWISDNWPTISAIVGMVATAVKTAFQIIAEIIRVVAPIIIEIARVVFPMIGAAAKLVLAVIRVAFEAIGAIWDAAATKIKIVVKTFTTAFDNLKLGVRTAWNAITGIIKGAINIVIGVINGMIRGLNRIQIHIPGISVGPVQIAGFDWNGLNLGTIPYLAQGTPWFKGGWAMLGENGPELAKLPRGTQVYSNADTTAMMGGNNEPKTIQHIEHNYNLEVKGLVKAKDPFEAATQLRRLADFRQLTMIEEPS